MIKFIKISYFYINSILIFISILFNIIANNYSPNEILQGEFYKAKTLSSGNFFVACSKGLFIYNYDFSSNKTIYNFGDEISDSNSNEANTFIYEIIKNKISYILCLVNELKLFFIKNEEIILNIIDFNYIAIYSMIPLEINNSILQYIIFYKQNENLELNLYEFDLFNNNTTLKNQINTNIIVSYISCQEMKDPLGEDILTCFWTNEEKVLKVTSFYTKNELYIIEKMYHDLNLSSEKVLDIKSSLLFDRTKSFVCYLTYDNIFSEYNSICLIYNIEKNTFEETNILTYGYHKLEIYSFLETNQYALLFYKEDNGIYEFKLILFNGNSTVFEINKNNEKNIPLFQGNINCFSLVYSIKKGEYNIIFEREDEFEVYETEKFIYYILSISSAEYTNYYSSFLNASDDSNSIEYSPTTYLSDEIFSDSSQKIDLPSNIISDLFTSDISSIYTDKISDNMISSILSTDTNENDSSTNNSYLLPSTFISDSLSYNNEDKINTSIPIYESSSDLIIDKISSSLNSEILSSLIYSTDIDLDINLLDEIIMNKTKDEINEIIPQILSKIKIGEYYKLTGNDFSMTIRPLNSNNTDNSTYVDFSNCEEILRQELKISPSNTLTFLQVEINNINE